MSRPPDPDRQGDTGLTLESIRVTGGPVPLDDAVLLDDGQEPSNDNVHADPNASWTPHATSTCPRTWPRSWPATSFALGGPAPTKG